MTLAWWWVWAALPLPWILARIRAGRQRHDTPALRAPAPLAAAALQTGAARLPSGARPRAHRLGALGLWLLLLLAASRPQWLPEPVEIRESARDVMLAVDLSRSMGEKDFELDGQRVSRLAIVKRVAADFVRRRQGDRIGLILFGAQAYVQTPLTFDRHTVATMLEESEIGIAGNETAIGDAIGLAVKRLRVSDTDKVLLLLTDGANTGGAVEPQQAARLARLEGLRIHTVGLGSPPVWRTNRLAVYQFNATADLDEAALQDVAHATGGRYFRASDRAALERVYDSIDALEPAERTGRTVQPVRELFRWPLAAVLVLAALMIWPAIARRGAAVAAGRTALQ